MIATERLNVTSIEPRFKHLTIFKHFDELEPGEGFVIENDHDPKPLYYQLLGERGDIFTWEYLEQGPEWWFVRITKRKKDEETVGEIAAKDYRKAEVFKKLGIDFCCGGKKTLEEAGEEAGITKEELKTELQKAELQDNKKLKEYDKWELGFLVDYIINVHHRYVRENATIINELLEKVALHHGANHPELLKMSPRVSKFLNELIGHLYKEERIHFHYIKSLESGKNNNEANNSTIEGIEERIESMTGEHEDAGRDLKYFRTVTNNYTLPADACNSYNYLFEKMKEFEADLMEHIHIENNILFPKVIQIEKELKIM